MSDRPLLDRAQIAKLAGGVPQAIAGLEKIVSNVAGFPSTIEEANALAGSALAVMQAALASLAVLAAALEQLEAAPALVPQVDADDTTPRAHLGTISSQNADQVDITGGRAGLDGGAVGSPSLFFGGDSTTGLYRSDSNALGMAINGVKLLDIMAEMLKVTGNFTVTKQIISVAPPGTPPLQVDSSTKVANLYVDRAAEADHAVNANALLNPSNYPANATDLPSAIALVNALKAAAIDKGL